jgi:hypothetical protein
MECVYILRYNVWIDDMWKIGRTYNIKTRLGHYKTHNGFLPETILVKYVEYCDKIEDQYHANFNDKLVKTTREYFILDEEDIKKLLNNDGFTIYDNRYNILSLYNVSAYELFLKELEIKERTKQIEIQEKSIQKEIELKYKYIIKELELKEKAKQNDIEMKYKPIIKELELKEKAKQKDIELKYKPIIKELELKEKAKQKDIELKYKPIIKEIELKEKTKQKQIELEYKLNMEKEKTKQLKIELELKRLEPNNITFVDNKKDNYKSFLKNTIFFTNDNNDYIESNVLYEKYIKWYKINDNLKILSRENFIDKVIEYIRKDLNLNDVYYLYYTIDKHKILGWKKLTLI